MDSNFINIIIFNMNDLDFYLSEEEILTLIEKENE